MSLLPVMESGADFNFFNVELFAPLIRPISTIPAVVRKLK
jgi:hypothetical protein